MNKREKIYAEILWKGKGQGFQASGFIFIININPLMCFDKGKDGIPYILQFGISLLS